jgi:hypothetical protein
MRGARCGNGIDCIIKIKDGRWVAKIQVGTDAIIKFFYGKERKIVAAKLKEYQLNQI